MSVCSNRDTKTCADSSWGFAQIRNTIYVNAEPQLKQNNAHSSVASNVLDFYNIEKFEKLSLKGCND